MTILHTQALPLRTDAWPYATPSLVEVARGRAGNTPQATAFTFINHAAEPALDETLSHAQLDQRARQIATLLQSRGQPGARVLLLYPGGLDYICAFFGCLYAGMVAVPAYPPLNPRLRERLAAVAQDCEASIALTDAATLGELGERSAMLAPLARLHWFSTDSRLDGLEYAARCVPTSRDQLAFLQYTSGSSGTPKGVMVSHGNLLHNVLAISRQMQIGPEDHVFSWLPPYHDMGLIGSILTPFCAGVPMSFITPLAFLRRPARWLREIAQRGCSISGAPNFAFELCADKVSDADMAGLDLSRWSLAFTGAEPIKPATLAKFALRFAPFGFARQAFYPCYGMAETTLMVTGKQRAVPHQTLCIDRDAYAQQRLAIEVPTGTPDAQVLVACGQVADGLQVLVVEPDTLAPLQDGQVGEIVVAGESVAGGYWQRGPETLASFGLAIAGHQGSFLRTGDLGFVHGGALFVSGRLKDLVIVHGVNHYPQDIEATVDQSHAAVRAGCGICFSLDVGHSERVVVVQEVGRRDSVRADEIIQAIRLAVHSRHDIQAHAVVLVENGSIPKTTSGKLSRRPCREAYLRDGLKVVARWCATVAAQPGAAASPQVPADTRPQAHAAAAPQAHATPQAVAAC